MLLTDKLVDKEDVLEDICKSCKAHETCDLSTFREKIFCDIDDIIKGRIECCCMKEDILKEMKGSVEGIVEDKAVVILSGGMDSTTLAYELKKRGLNLYAISFNYGQRHADKELECAKRTCNKLKIPWKIVDISNLKDILKGSSLTDNNVSMPHRKYDEESMKLTVVPNRNMILLSIAAGYALSIRVGMLFYGAHAGDHTIYPDCRPLFVKCVQDVLKICDWNGVDLIAPYLHIDKSSILKKGLKLGVDYADTWTCYEGGDKPCGLCGSCNERKEAYEKLGVEDPLYK